MAAPVPVFWTSLQVSHRCSQPQRLLLKIHLSFQAHFKRHHPQEALLDTQDPLLNSP